MCRSPAWRTIAKLYRATSAEGSSAFRRSDRLRANHITRTWTWQIGFLPHASPTVGAYRALHGVLDEVGITAPVLRQAVRDIEYCFLDYILEGRSIAIDLRKSGDFECGIAEEFARVNRGRALLETTPANDSRRRSATVEIRRSRSAGSHPCTYDLTDLVE